MKLLLDTHVLLLAAGGKLSIKVAALLEYPENDLALSVASLWEMVIKLSRPRPDFIVDPMRLRRTLSVNGYAETPVTAEHVLALVEGATLLTSGGKVAAYPADILRI